jgi:GTP cyclohydrolase I
MRVDRPDERIFTELEVTDLIRMLGDDPTRDGLRDTPKRFLKAFADLTSGYAHDPAEPLRRTFALDRGHSDPGMVICRDIEIYSLCEHHILPFYGRAHIVYIPDGERVVGLSKLARCADILAHRLQVQERLTQQIAGTIQAELKPVGVMVVLDCTHLCMRMRGVGKQNSQMVTSTVIGAFEGNHSARAEALALIKGGTL